MFLVQKKWFLGVYNYLTCVWKCPKSSKICLLAKVDGRNRFGSFGNLVIEIILEGKSEKSKLREYCENAH